MKTICFVAIVLAVLLVAADGARAGKAQNEHWLVFDNHPTGGTGATGQKETFALDDSRIEGPGKCGHMFLGGTAFGHPDPRIKDPSAVCAHGIAARAPGPVSGGPQGGETGPVPLSILPIEAPMPVEGGSASVDAARLIRDMLPKIDKSDGDKMPVVIQIRDTIRSLDVLSSAKNTPKRQARQ